MADFVLLNSGDKLLLNDGSSRVLLNTTIEVGDELLLNDGSNVLLNDGVSVVLLNTTSAAAGGLTVPENFGIADLRGIGKKKKKQYKFPFELKGRIIENQYIKVHGKILNRQTFEALSRIYQVNPSKFYSRVFINESKFIAKSRVSLIESKLKKQKIKELQDILREYENLG